MYKTSETMHWFVNRPENSKTNCREVCLSADEADKRVSVHL